MTDRSRPRSSTSTCGSGPTHDRVLRGRDEQVAMELSRGRTSTGAGGGSSAAARSPTSAATTSTCRSGLSDSPRPRSVTATGKKTYTGDNATPDVMQVDYEFPAPNEPGRPPDLVPRRQRAGPRRQGRPTRATVRQSCSSATKGTAHRRLRQVHSCCPRSSRRTSSAPEKSIPASIGHHKEWCEAIKNGGHDDVQLRLLGPADRGGAARQRGLSRGQGDRVGQQGGDHRQQGRGCLSGPRVPQRVGTTRGLGAARIQEIKASECDAFKESRSQGVKEVEETVWNYISEVGSQDDRARISA